MPAPRRRRGLVLKKNRVFEKRVSFEDAADRAAGFQRITGGARPRRGPGRPAGQLVGRRPRASGAASAVSSTPRTPKPSSPKRSPVRKAAKAVRNFRANRARNKAAKARAKAARLRARG